MTLAESAGHETAVCAWSSARRHAIYRPTWTEIDSAAFARNLAAVRSRVKKRTGIIAVIKANAYGHGAAALARAAAAGGACMLGVSSIEEAVALRESGIRAPVLILGSIFPLTNLAVCHDHDLIPTLSSLQGLRALAALARRRGMTPAFHLKIDTGMGRIGVSPRGAARVLEAAAAEPAVRLQGLYTHFSCADSDPAATRHQLSELLSVAAHARTLGLKPLLHAANSAALFSDPATHLDMVRPGLALYGISPFGPQRALPGLEPVLAWKSRIVFLKRVARGTPVSYGHTFTTRRRSVIATLPVGYADGYPRSLSGHAEVLVRGRRCPVAGRVTMDMIMLDVTAVPAAAIGDEAVLIGGQGRARITADELSRAADTIPYELLCGISGRVPRILDARS